MTLSIIDRLARRASLYAARDRLDIGYEDERDRLERQLEQLRSRFEQDRLELDTFIGDEDRELRALGFDE